MSDLAKELERIFGRLKFECECPYCHHKWTYVPHSGIPDKHVTCPSCRRKISLLRYCKLKKE